MKNYILGALIALGLITPTFALAQVTGDIDPNTSQSSCVNLSYNMRYRANDATTGGNVSQLQDFLQSKGYLSIDPTGYYGLLTTSAVKSFQNANGILNSGYTGPITRAKIATVSCSTSLSSSSSLTSTTGSSLTTSTELPLTVCNAGALYNYITGKPCGTNQVVCTDDVKLCSDGSYVSRGGPSCTFSACPSTAVASLVNPANLIACNLDVDGNGNKDALTDGLLITRYLNSYRGSQLVSGATGSGATRTSSADIEAFIASHNYDVDGDGSMSPLTDGQLISRYLFGLSGTSLISGAIGSGAVRITSDQITGWLNSCTPLTQVAAAPTVNVTLNGTAGDISVTSGTPVTLAWSSTNATSCTLGLLGSSRATSGTNSVTQSTTGSFAYPVTCTGAGGSVTVTRTLTVTPSVVISTPISVPFPYGGASLSVGQTTTITWGGGTAGTLVNLSLTGGSLTSSMSIINTIPATQGSFQWRVPTSLTSGSYRIQFTSSSGTSLGSSDVFSVTVPAPTILACNLDVDGNGTKDALTDGLLIKRYQNGTRGDSLISGVIATNATRRDSASIEAFIASHDYDVDGDGSINSLSDGTMILQYLFDASGSSITTGMIGVNAVRKTVPDIVAWLNSCGPQVLGVQKFIFSQYLQIGSTGNEVIELQKVLTRLGYYTGDVTGYFGEATKAAVVGFQSASGITAEGVVGPLTREKLNSL